mmetsp:Transcript_21054/g.51763  ORF Transcript_21054/g.51763 Transcript_21054/m.51763 type:complete len:248 (-) Transcript_21054:345-1088(-)
MFAARSLNKCLISISDPRHAERSVARSLTGAAPPVGGVHPTTSDMNVDHDHVSDPQSGGPGRKSAWPQIKRAQSSGRAQAGLAALRRAWSESGGLGELNLLEDLHHLLASRSWRVLGRIGRVGKSAERREGALGGDVRKEGGGDAPGRAALGKLGLARLDCILVDDDLVHASLHAAAGEVLHLQPCLDEQAAIGHLDTDLGPVPQPRVQPRVARLAVDREQVEIVVPARERRLELSMLAQVRARRCE